MAKLYGKNYTRQQLSRLAGSLPQLGGVRLMEHADGLEKGVRTAEVRSGTGLNFSVLLDRGMDIGTAEFRGIPLSWVSRVGYANPAFFEPQGNGWLRTWGGGLLTGCGLTYTGTPSIEDGEDLGLHGRVSHIPARHAGCGETWQGDECVFWVEGELREGLANAASLLLKRRVETSLGGSSIRVFDTVLNEGFEPLPLMTLYHVNVGFPLLDDRCRLLAAPHTPHPRTAEAAGGLSAWEVTQPPTPAYREQVFYHDIPANPQGWSEIALENPRLGLRFSVRQKKDTLPLLVQWKQMGEGLYVMGLEPANARLEGRPTERAHNALPFIQPGETREFALEIAVDSIPAA